MTTTKATQSNGAHPRHKAAQSTPVMARQSLISAICSFTVPGKPAQQGDLAANRRGKLYHKNKALEPWRYEIGWRARKAMRANGFANVLFASPISVSLVFVMTRPKAMSKLKATPPAITRPDLDKLTRAVLDALTEVVYVDDSQVVEMHCYKRTAEPGENPGLTIEINRIVEQGDWVDASYQ